MTTVVNRRKVSQVAFQKISGGYAPGSKHQQQPHGFIASRFKKNQNWAIFTLTYNDYNITVNRRKTPQIASPAF